MTLPEHVRKDTGRHRIVDGHRIVIKIGSALLLDESNGTVRQDWLAALAGDISRLREDKREIVLVSSGAVGVGQHVLGISDPRSRLEDKQAAAAVGQIRLAHAYQEALAPFGITVAQILLTPDDTEQRRRHLNARNTIDALLALGSIPVINENDSVATDEIRFGDNDRLAARVAQMISADTLVLLSDIDGLYTADPRQSDSAEWLPEIREITPEIEAMAGEPGRGYSSGGMVTKLAAGRIAMGAGCRMVIADGKPDHPLRMADDGGRGTWFLPAANPGAARKRWIAASLDPQGSIIIDDGAAEALAQGKSLLPAGARAINGDFRRGDTVSIKSQTGAMLGRGLIAYNAGDAAAIIGHKSRDIEGLLGYRGRSELIHRDDLVLETGGTERAEK